MTETKITLPEARFRSAGTTSPPTCRTAAAGAPPRHRRARRPGRPRPALPDGPHPPGGLAGRGGPIPDAVRDVYRLWRPTPLYRAHRLEAALGTRSRIFYKYEGTSPAGSHKPNTAIAQAYYVKESGRTRIATETGAGQWGSAVALAAQFFGLECKVYMVKVSYEQKPYRRSMMETWGATVVASPSEDTNSGRAVLEADPDSPGAWASPSRRRSRTQHSTTTPPTRSAACSTTCSCTRR